MLGAGLSLPCPTQSRVRVASAGRSRITAALGPLSFLREPCDLRSGETTTGADTSDRYRLILDPGSSVLRLDPNAYSLRCYCSDYRKAGMLYAVRRSLAEYVPPGPLPAGLPLLLPQEAETGDSPSRLATFSNGAYCLPPVSPIRPEIFVAMAVETVGLMLAELNSEPSGAR
jgi:hypothetical protein